MIMEKPTLYYIYDALCGWCYGFSPVMQKLQRQYAAHLTFEVLSGGMIIGSRVQPIGAMAEYIRRASAQLESVTGISPSEAYQANILDAGTYISNSVPPAVALCILKEASPDAQVPLASAIQQLLYGQGKDLNEADTYLPLAAEQGMTEEVFRERFADPAYEAKARQEFSQVQSWGIEGFPAVIACKGSMSFLLTHGYQPYEPMSEMVEQMLEG